MRSTYVKAQLQTAPIYPAADFVQCHRDETSLIWSSQTQTFSLGATANQNKVGLKREDLKH